ncbi:MAG: Hsp20/alpha crystallin family protein [Pseudomonadota bacterium]
MTEKDTVPARQRPQASPASFHPFDWFRQEMDDLFTRPFSMNRLPSLSGESGSLASSLASLDVRETDEAVEVCVDLPGLDEDDIQVALNQGALTIKGERKDETEDKGKDYHRIERSYGSFSRRIALPAEIDEAGVAAVFEKGVLTVTLPKSKEAKAKERKITVKAV